MHWIVAVTALLAVGPVLDPIAGEHLTTEDRDVLPAARHLGALADIWMVQLVNMQNSGGGIDLFDPLYLSAHGRSWSQLVYKIGAIDHTDPARPGRPLFDVPHLAWDAVDFRSLWTDAPGFAWNLDPNTPDAPTARISGTFGGDVGGGVWIPSGVFDRDPAFPFGAPATQRALHMARELVASTRFASPWGPVRLFGEIIGHNHHYLTQTDPDLADRSTVLATSQITATPWPIDVLVGWQNRHRNHEGAQFRWPQAFTQNTHAQSVIAQGKTTGPLANLGTLHLALGGGWRHDSATAASTTPWVTDLENAWLYQARPTYPSDSQRWHVGGEARWTLPAPKNPLSISLKGRLAAVQNTPTIVGGRDGTTYGGNAITQTVYAPATQENLWLRHVRLGADWQTPTEPLWLQLTAAVDFGAVGSGNTMRLGQWGPAVGVAARLPLGGGELFGLLRREPESLTAQVGDFVNPTGLSGTVYTWEDNGDLIPAANEVGAAVGRTGPPFHTIASDLSRPSSNAFAIGYRTAPFGPLRFVLTGVGRALQNRYTVATNVPSTSQTSHDPGGDGRGETPVPGGGQTLTAGAQDPASLAQATYVLTNDGHLAYYLGVELDLVSENTRWWFLNLGAAAYLSAGSAPFGFYPDRNDPGVVDESSAGPNNSFNKFGRYDHDRSFAIKLLTGVKPAEGLSIAIAARYRDGQPFTRMIVDPNLPQGPQALMAVARGEPRFTFNMTWDLRVRYAVTTWAPFYVTAWADVFNLFGSATELLEDPRTGSTFRHSVEAVPGRAMLMNLEVGWL